METQKIVNLLNDFEELNSKFTTRKWCIINDQNNGQYGIENDNDSTINSKEKLLNQISLTTQMHIFLWQEM